MPLPIDIQDRLAVDLAGLVPTRRKAAATTARPLASRPSRGPRPITDTSWIVARFGSERPRFLCRDQKHGHWVVVTTPDRALKFPDEAAARAALIDFQVRGLAAHAHDPRGDWLVYEASTRTSFSPALATS